MTKKSCPLGEDCDLTIAWMKKAEDARDKIKELEAELNLMKTSGIAEVAVRNPSVMEYMKHWEGRAETAEAKLAKAVKDLKGWLEVSQHCTIEDGVCWCGEDMKNHRNSTNYAHSPVDHGAYVARRLAESTRATLAEIEGGKP
jgi:hypothetical protein